jgi:Cys-rich repeat protein
MRGLALALALGCTALLGLGTGCITSRCLRDADCTGGQVCQTGTGACVDPECSVDTDCGAGRVCEQRFCVAGCASQADCADTEQCVDRRCLPIGAECDCPLAHQFCGTDINPNSPTSGTEICVDDSFPDGVGLFFGSIYCGHCTGDFAALRTRRAELTAEGLPARMIWVQLKTALSTPEDVAAHLGPDVTDPVIHDTDALGLWDAYATTWYHFILVDSHGCRLTDYGPLDSAGVLGEVGDQILAEWRDAMDDTCPDGTPPVDGGDAGTDAGDDAGADADAPDEFSADSPPETADESTAEASDADADAEDAPAEVREDVALAE